MDRGIIPGVLIRKTLWIFYYVWYHCRGRSYLKILGSTAYCHVQVDLFHWSDCLQLGFSADSCTRFLCLWPGNILKFSLLENSMAILSLGQSVSEQGTKIATIISQHHNYRTFHPFSIFSHPITSRGTDSSAVMCGPVRVTHQGKAHLTILGIGIWSKILRVHRSFC